MQKEKNANNNEQQKQIDSGGLFRFHIGLNIHSFSQNFNKNILKCLNFRPDCLSFR